MTPGNSNYKTPLLQISDLTVDFETANGPLRVLHGTALEVGRSEIIGLVGESGSGKSVTCMAVMRLLGPTARIGGSAVFNGRDLFSLGEKEMTRLRGGSMAMVFQDPMSSLNPVHTVGRQIMESLYFNPVDRAADSPGGSDVSAAGKGSWSRRFRDRAVNLLTSVGITDAGNRLTAYPHQLSGGMSQRAMIAMSLAGRPQLLIADEPTTALDVTIQAQILDLIRRLRDEYDLSVILITHDLGVVAETCDRAAVMYAGRIVEIGSIEHLFEDPRHPYTVGLLASIPGIDARNKQLRPMAGSAPAPGEIPAGCSFEPRCPRSTAECRIKQPAMADDAEGRCFACFNPHVRN